MQRESMTSLLARWSFAVYLYFFVLLWGITKQIVTVVIGYLLEIVSPQLGNYYPPPLALGNIFPTSGKQFPIVTSTTVTICII